MWIPRNENDARSGDPEVGVVQMLGLWETVPNSCDTPTNRGATTDPSTWVAAISNDGSSAGCDPSSDASTEEILHLITEAAKGNPWGLQDNPWWWFGECDGSCDFPTTGLASAAVQAANGNCGWGYARTYKDPSSNACEGWYAYDDRTCDPSCLIVEGIYWAVVARIGGLYTDSRARQIKNEWVLATPRSGFTVIPSNVRNAASLESGAPGLWSLVSDTTSTGYAWLPDVMPDGVYTVGSPSPLPSPSPSPSPRPPGSYFMLSGEATCEDADGLTINEEEECKVAGADRGIDVNGATVIDGARWAPKGCSYEQDTDEFYTQGKGKEGSSCGSQFACVCKNLPSPLPSPSPAPPVCKDTGKKSKCRMARPTKSMCTKKTKYQHKFCKKSCKICGPCEDIGTKTKCKKAKPSKKICRKEATYQHKFCRQSCGLCSKRRNLLSRLAPRRHMRTG